MAAGVAAAACLAGSGRAGAEPARPAPPIVIAPFEANVYPAPASLPAGLQPMTIEDRAGRRQACAGQEGCSPAMGTFAGWFGKTEGRIPSHVQVRVAAIGAYPARSDRDWARKVREATYDIEHHHVSFHHASGEARIWLGPHGRIVQSEIQYGGRELDPVWKLSRHEQRDGWTLHLEIRVFGRPDDATRAGLRAAFANGPLGAAPATAKVLKGL